jgi:hypothetical protein
MRFYLMCLLRVSFFSFVLMMTVIPAKAQYYFYDDRYYDRDMLWEVGFSLGGMNCLADIGSKKGGMPDLKTTQLNGSFYAGFLYKNLAGLRFEYTRGRIAGADANGISPERNLSFRTPISEIAVIGEFHPCMLKYYDDRPRFSPYVAAGIGRFSFNPQANLNGNWIDLHPLRTEGQGFPEVKAAYSKTDYTHYRLQQTAVLAGIGAKFELNQLFSIRTEILYRYTSTDYLDDASQLYIDPAWFDNNLSPYYASLAKQLYDREAERDPTKDYFPTGSIGRGNPKTNDAYFSWNVKIGINLGRQRMWK